MVEAIADATALQQLAQRYCDRGRFDLSRKRLLTALTKLSAPDLDPVAALLAKVRVLVTLSVVEVELYGSDHGREHLAESQRIATQLGALDLGFVVDNALALRALRVGDSETALRHFALAEKEMAGATVAEACTLMLNRGNLFLQQLQLDKARSDLNRCITLAEAALDSNPQLGTHVFMARHNLGWLEFLAGNLPKALSLMDAAAAEPVGVSLAISALDKSRVLIEAGLSDAADQALLSAEAGFRRGRLYQELAETELARAECAILADNFQAAHTLASSAKARFGRRGNERWRRVAELTLLTADLTSGRPPAQLIDRAALLADEFAAQDLELQARAAQLITCTALLRAGRPAEARSRFAHLQSVSRSDPLSVTLQYRAVAAALLQASHQPTSARREVRRGLDELSHYQAKFGSIDLQMASAIHGRQLVRLSLDLALASPRPAAVFNAIERGRAVSRRLSPVTPPLDESAELLAELRQLTVLIKSIGDEPGRSGQVKVIRERAALLRNELRAISWRAAGDGDVAATASMARVADAAERHDMVVVSFCQHNSRWSAVVLGDGRPRFVPLAGDDRILELVRSSQASLNVLAYASLPTTLRVAATSSVRRALKEIDDNLIAPLRLHDRQLVIVPTGPTATLPWNCLPSLRGRPIQVSPTATSWLSGMSRVDTVGDVTVEVFAGSELAAASQEASQVAKIWGAHSGQERLYLGARASREHLRQALASATVVHVATHGSHMPQNPLFSSLQLADGALFAYEIADRQVAPHVVLSACELGQATLRPGDEALGLTRVLLQLGAQCVIAGVAQVADDQAGDVMVDYHRRLAGGADSASALAAATESGPYVPFVCFGSSWRAVSS